MLDAEKHLLPDTRPGQSELAESYPNTRQPPEKACEPQHLGGKWGETLREIDDLIRKLQLIALGSCVPRGTEHGVIYLGVSPFQDDATAAS